MMLISFKENKKLHKNQQKGLQIRKGVLNCLKLKIWFFLTEDIKTTRLCHKLDWKKLGPFSIIKKINSVTYRLKLHNSMQRIHNVFHVSLLLPA